MIEVVLNDRLGKKVRVKCNGDDTVGDLKKLAAAQLGTRPEKLRIQKWYTIYKDHITLEDYEIHDGMGLELYYTDVLRVSCGKGDVVSVVYSCVGAFLSSVFSFSHVYNNIVI
eukprot:CAMPEP_0194345304 /NCGR_PEP_ID=MMETSP0171-20130528/104779_1 /TAXON_ID=218684 /ORGANISM="Corethron pennatum, Strain L29A3" /LENGTH=112 /DNA_ID=CAMNT_0039112269 /DNA_START=1269 /DNA_END=1608 /DNA_ORIENTATION=-